MPNDRFTAYLSEGERTALRAMARENGTSENYLVRVALRQFLGLGNGFKVMLKNPSSVFSDDAVHS